MDTPFRPSPSSSTNAGGISTLSRKGRSTAGAARTDPSRDAESIADGLLGESRPNVDGCSGFIDHDRLEVPHELAAPFRLGGLEPLAESLTDRQAYEVQAPCHRAEDGGRDSRIDLEQLGVPSLVGTKGEIDDRVQSQLTNDLGSERCERLRWLEHGSHCAGAHHLEVVPRGDDDRLPVPAEDVHVPLIPRQVLLNQIRRKRAGVPEDVRRLLERHKEAPRIFLQKSL